MAKELRLNQRIRYGSAINHDKGLFRARSRKMDMPRDQLFAGARFALYQHGAGHGHRATGALENIAHGRTFSDDVAQGHGLVNKARQHLVAAPQFMPFTGARHDQEQLVLVKGFFEIVGGPFFYRGHCGFYGGVGGHHDDVHVRVQGLGVTQQFQAVHARHLHVRQQHVVWVVAQGLERFHGVGARTHLIAGLT